MHSARVIQAGEQGLAEMKTAVRVLTAITDRHDPEPFEGI
jgi:hypothetical protein